jgi:polyhydroxyalkanoate synthesis regulator phasin
LVEKGQLDLEHGRESVEALLVSIAASRLRKAGLRIARVLSDPEHRLYEKLAQAEPDSAHSRYNALLRRLTSFESALECVY